MGKGASLVAQAILVIFGRSFHMHILNRMLTLPVASCIAKEGRQGECQRRQVVGMRATVSNFNHSN